MYAVIRKTVFGLEEDLSFERDDIGYLTSKNVAENIAEDLTDVYKDDDTIGHPWHGDKFYARNVSQDYINSMHGNWAMQRACAEMSV